MNGKKLTPARQTEEKLLADREVTRREDDHFNYQDYASILAGLASEADTPLVVGIFGRWGSGKTSLMHLIEVELGQRSSKSNPIQTIWLNVWQLSTQEELWNAFLQALLTTVHQKMPFYRRWAFDLDLLLRRLRWGDLVRQILVNSYRILIVIIPLLLTLLWPQKLPQEPGRLISLILDPVTGGAASLVLGLWLLVKPTVEAAREVVSLDLGKTLKEAPYEVRVSSLQQLQGQFNRLVRTWVGKRGRLAVFVDDLDRCTPDKAPEVFEALKLFATTHGCIYILGMDYTMLRQGIATRYKFSADEASEYLEKIIQIPFHLPPLEDERIAKFVRNAYPDLVQTCQTAPLVFSLGLEPNPRKVKRALNTYRTLLELAKFRQAAWEIENVNPELLAKIVVIQSRFSRLYDYLVTDPGVLGHLDEINPSVPIHDSFTPEVRKTIFELPSDDGKHEGLVDAADLPALRNMLLAGNARFNSLQKPIDGEADLPTYIYLTGTASGTAEHLRPEREDRNLLLSGDHNRVKDRIEELVARGREEGDANRYQTIYRPKLENAIDKQEVYSMLERRSANWALVCFDIALDRDIIEALKAAILREDDPFLHVQLGEQYQLLQQLREAIEEYTLALQFEPDYPGLRDKIRELQRPAPETRRPLTPLEIEEARLVFGDGLNYDRIRVIENARLANFFGNLNARLTRQPKMLSSLTLGYNCYFPTQLRTTPADIASSYFAELAWLMHELTHVWQYQRMGWGYLSKSLNEQFRLGSTAYSYGSKEGLASARDHGKRLSDFQLEQQGDIARDFYLNLKSGKDTTDWTPFVENFRSASLA